MGEGHVDPELAAGTPEAVGQSADLLLLLLLGRRRLLLLPPPPVLLGGDEAAAGAARVPRPHADALGLGVVEALGAAGGAAHAVEAGVEHVALVRLLAGVHAVLSGAVSVACNGTRVRW